MRWMSVVDGHNVVPSPAPPSLSKMSVDPSRPLCTQDTSFSVKSSLTAVRQGVQTLSTDIFDPCPKRSSGRALANAPRDSISLVSMAYMANAPRLGAATASHDGWAALSRRTRQRAPPSPVSLLLARQYVIFLLRIFSVGGSLLYYFEVYDYNCVRNRC